MRILKSGIKINNEFLFLSVLIPIFDFFIFFHYSKYYSGNISIIDIILYLVDALFSWAAIFIFLVVIYSFSRTRFKPLNFMVQTFLYVFIFIASVNVLFSWNYIVKNGYPVSIDVLYFLLKNSSHAPLHLLQTAPLVFTGFILACILFSLILYKIVKHLYEYFHHKKTFNKHLSIKLGTSIVITILIPVLSGLPSSVAATYFFKSLSTEEEISNLSLKLKPFGNESSHEQPAALKNNVIILLVESLRKDLIEVNPSPATFLQSLAQESIVFDKSYATASHSNYADLAFWYSQYPLRTRRLQKYPRDAVWRGESAFTTFKNNGYATAYISSQNELWGDMINWLDISEVDYFFDAEDYEGDTWAKNDVSNGLVSLIQSGIATAGKIEDSKTLRIAENWIKKNKGQAFFLGLNLQNTHFSYIIPDGEPEPFQPADIGAKAIYYNWPESKRVEIKNRYYNAVYNQDKAIADFSTFLKDEGLWNNSVFVIVGDSGEAFYEHGFGNHSGPMYDEIMRTLTIIKPAKNISENKTGRFNKAISHIDVLPTVMDMVGIQAPETFQGLSVFSKEHSKRPVYMHTNAMVYQYGIVDWPWKLLVTTHPDKLSELYNLESDSNEKVNLIYNNKVIYNKLRSNLDAWVSSQLAYYKYPINFRSYYPPKYIKDNTIKPENIGR